MMDLTEFDMEVNAVGVTTALSYSIAIPDTTTAEGIIILNFPYTVTGTDKVSGDFSYTYANSEVTITPVPEPSTFALAALGLSSLGMIGWRRKRKLAA